MGKGEFQKENTTTWTDTQAKKFSAKAGTTSKVMHANSNQWHENYPQTKLYEQYFNVTWTQGYNSAGTKLDYGIYGDHPRAGSTFGFIGLFGFDHTALVDFVEDGIIQNMQIEIAFDSPASGVDPDIYFGAHFYWTKPNSIDWDHIDSQYKTLSTFTNYGYDYRKWVIIPNLGWWNGSMGGVADFGDKLIQMQMLQDSQEQLRLMI